MDLLGTDLVYSAETDPRRFRQRVAAFLEQAPVERTLPITVLDALQSGLYTTAVLALVSAEDSAVTGCAIQTPPHNLIVAASTTDAVHALARGLRARKHEFPGVVGLTPWVHEFARAWCEGGAGLTAEDDRAERLFQLAVVAPPRPAPGSARLATLDDLNLLMDWNEAFGREVGGARPPDLRRSVVVRVETGRAWLWVAGGEVVSYAGHSPVLLGHARIGPVYTPPTRRAAGFASNLVARVSGRLLELGAVPTLFTDLANPTSNAIYRALGYTAVADAFEVRFVPPARDT